MATDEEMHAARAAALTAILDSDAQRRLIVAGAGTGKSFTFRRIVETTESGRCLVMTFLNMLVDDLEGDLGEVADVRTFHGFARGLLHKVGGPGVTRSVDYYPAIDALFETDLVIGGQSATQDDISKALMDLDTASPITKGVLHSGEYYNAVGHVDSVYRVWQQLTADPGCAPSYAAVLVDEYQDFSRLEVELIELLGETNKLVIVGDDDQALYAFRHASADYIRERAEDNRYDKFQLAFCTRCTEVLVRATHLVVGEAKKLGLLPGRIDKPYICFTPDKREESAQYPKITHVQCSVDSNVSPYIAKVIDSQIRQISADDIAESHDKGFPTVMVIGPKQFTGRIFDYLEAQGTPNLTRKGSSSLSVEPLDGYRRLMKNARSRLGWRILLECQCPEGWQHRVETALKDGTDLWDLLPDGYRTEQLAVVALLMRLKADESLDDAETSTVQRATGLRLDLLKEALQGTETTDEVPVDRDAPTVLFTSLMGSKGLQAAHVFVVGLNEGHFPQNASGPTEDEVCKLIVALTRGRKSCTVMSCTRYAGQPVRPSCFLRWLAPVTRQVRINKDSFK